MMELRAFAEQVLFSTSLEEKLFIPRSITDENPGRSIGGPALPGRPKELVFKAQGTARDSFPGLSRLEQETERGRLLHFFANHELLATELMALVLLRFPEAPAAFRQGVFETLKDEQRHTLLYLKQMKACGVAFGEMPVSGYFWNSIAPMQNPVDYVAGLSLTFEQANLDFCRHYSEGFLQVGDTTTARLLDRIYHDEIGHVAYGLKWFRRWKDPAESDWDAFCRHLRYPLSPQRAKGIGFNIAGRREAGLDPDFIAKLEVYARSRGRTPTVTVFNPLTEALIGRAAPSVPPKLPARLVEDLETLPQFLCRQDDIVVVRNLPSTAFLQSIRRAGFPLPEFIRTNGDPAALRESLADRKLGGLRPWAWGPDSLRLLDPLSALLGEGIRTAGQACHEAIIPLYAKSWSSAFLRSLLEEAGPPSWLCRTDEAGLTVASLDEALDVIGRIRNSGHHRLVVKQSCGLAGRNAIRLWEPALSDAQIRWMEAALQAGLTLVIEPWLDRVIDFSIQFEAGSKGLRLCGHTGLLNDHRGQFRGNWAHPNHRSRLPPEVIRLIRPGVRSTDAVYELFEVIRRRLEAETLARDYQGPIGIDAFLYRGADGAIRLKPVVEINPRHTMGRLTIELMRQVGPGRAGFFRIHRRTEISQAGFETFGLFEESLHRKRPLCLKGRPKPRIESGALCLNDPLQARDWLAVFSVGRDHAEN